MKRPISARSSAASKGIVPGFTLIEILVATTLSLLLLGIVITIFGNVSESITESRAMLEAADRMRLAEQRLQLDLAGATAIMNPPGRPDAGMGYFEYIEGPALSTSGLAYNSETGTVDQTVGDFDDILMFTTRSSGKPFVGKLNGGTIQSDVAEVAWFIRGRTLHRRVLLVAPNADLSAVMSPNGYYANNDVSARWNAVTGKMVPNTLADLTRRECRYAHPTDFPTSGCAFWTWTPASGSNRYPTLPTLWESSASTWSTEEAGQTTALAANLDFWTNESGHRVAENAFATGARVSDDIILTNVIGFDVKGWDPTLKMYVDLGDFGVGTGALTGYGATSLVMQGGSTTARAYDTWSTSHFDASASNGLDDNTNGIVDDDTERLKPPPYPVPLRGIQVKIRMFEPDSKQVREVTVEQTFLPQ